MTDTPTTPDTEAQFEARLREHLQPYLDMLPEQEEGEVVPSIMHVVGPVLAEWDTHRDRADAHEAMNAELRTEIERLRSQRAALWDLLKRATREARIWCRRANTAIADAVEQTARDMQRAGQLRQRAEQAEAEVARLRAELADAERIMVRDHQQAVRATQGRDEARAESKRLRNEMAVTTEWLRDELGRARAEIECLRSRPSAEES